MKNASKDDVLPIVGGERHLADRLQHHPELGLLVVLQHHPLRALFGDDALVVGQVEGRGLHAAIGVARREHGVDDADRRQRAELRVAVLRIDRQVVLDLLQLGPEARQLLRFGVVTQRDERLERRLVVEPLVFVDSRTGRWSARCWRRAPSRRRRCRSSRCSAAPRRASRDSSSASAACVSAAASRSSAATRASSPWYSSAVRHRDELAVRRRDGWS